MPKTAKTSSASARAKTLKRIERLFNVCAKKKCAALTKRKLKGQEIRKYKKLEKEKCASFVDNKDFYDCTNKIYKESGYDKIFSDWTVCTSKKCAKEKKAISDAY